MNILIACEESQRITIEMRKKGHECYSCDMPDIKNRAKLRSKTYEGIARAIAEQWG